MPALRMSQREPPRESRQLAALTRPHHQMPMVGHHAIGQQAGLGPLDGPLENSLEGLVVIFILEDRHPGIRAIEHVVNESTFVRSIWSAHPRTLPKDRPNVNKGS